jgi:hypothetical protein
MANNNILSFIAAGTITEYALVATDVNGKVAVCTDPQDDNCIGVAQRACSAGDAVEVALLGSITRAIAGGAIAPATMSLLMATTAGKLVAWDGGAGNYAVAQVLPNINQASASDGDQILVAFTAPSNRLS